MIDRYEPIEVLKELNRRLSHDLRGPFNNSIGVLSYLSEDGAHLGPEVSQDMIRALLETSYGQQWFIDTLLFWSRIELGEYAPEFEPTKLGDIIGALSNFAFLQGSADDKLTLSRFALHWFQDAVRIIERAFSHSKIKLEMDLKIENVDSSLKFSLIPLKPINGKPASDFLPRHLETQGLPANLELGTLTFTRMIEIMGGEITSNEKAWFLKFKI